MQLLRDFLNNGGYAAIITALTALATTIGGIFASKWNKRQKNKENAEFVDRMAYKVVTGVEQIYKGLKGSEKYQKAFENLSEILEKNGIYLSEIEIQMSIESIVCAFNEPWKYTAENTPTIEGFKDGENNGLPESDIQA